MTRARKLLPKNDQVCQSCFYGDDFAASYSKYCIKCESSHIRECRSCQVPKPLTGYPLSSSGLDGRERHCKQCKVNYSGKGFIVRCIDCEIQFKPRAGGDIYCEQCRGKPRSKVRRSKPDGNRHILLLHRSWMRPQAGSD